MESYFTKTIDWKMTIGHIFKTKNCGDIRILKQYGDFVDVEFMDTGYVKCRVSKSSVNAGIVNDPYARKVFGRGYMGECYTKDKKCWMTWHDMLRRKYDPSPRDGQYARSVEICEEWENLSAFQKWFNDNYIDGFVLDKDLLSGTLYSEDTCLYIPSSVNTMLSIRKMSSDVDPSRPVGVYKSKSKRLYNVKWTTKESHISVDALMGERYAVEVYLDMKCSAVYKEFMKFAHIIPAERIKVFTDNLYQCVLRQCMDVSENIHYSEILKDLSTYDNMLREDLV
jgi:hypothetical protein